jgi:type IV pilus assembly protein PilA
MRRQSGFSLIELLIVVAVILIIVAVAIPSLIRAKISANEASAVSSIRSIHSTETVYSLNYPSVGFADDIAKLGPLPPGTPATPAHAGLLDFVLGCAAQPCQKSGYSFAVDQTSGNPINFFRATGQPLTFQRTGVRGFCASTPGNVTADPNGGTNCTDPIN